MEKKEIIAQINNCMHLQQGMNAKVNPKWKTAGNNWRRAMWVEQAELVDLMGYKWWKNLDSPFDVKQALLEIVDIFHFVLSDSIINGVDAEQIYNTYLWSTKHTHAPTKEKKIQMVEEFVASLVDSETTSYLAQFFIVVHCLDISIESVLKYYVGKNALNLFRQDNGYKQGTYKKIWTYEGLTAEDNKFLENIIEGIDGSIVPNDVYNNLSHIYNHKESE